MFSHMLLVLVPTFIFFITSLVLVVKKYRGFTEEDHLGEPKLISPAFKLIKNVIVKMFLSAEVILTLITIYILSFTVAYAATFSHTIQTLDIEPQYDILLSIRDVPPLDVVDIVTERYVIVMKVFDGVEIGGEVYYILSIKCSRGATNISVEYRLAELLTRYCRYLERGYVVVDVSSGIDEESLSNMLGKNIAIARVELREIVDIELAPGIHIVHSIGTIGGLSLKIEYVDKLIVLPMDVDMLKAICNNGCKFHSIVLVFDHNVDVDKLNKLLSVFDYAIVKESSKAMAISRTYIPTPRTLLGVFLTLIMSMIITIAVSGGFIEKITTMGSTLFVIGITKDLFISIVTLGITVVMLIMSLPIATMCWLRITNGIAILGYILSAIGFTIITSTRLRTSIGKALSYGFASSYSYVIDMYIPPSRLIKCFKDFLAEDDFFQLSEVESIEEEKHHVVRVELMYRKALSTLSSVEIYIDRIDNDIRYTVVVDVWSMEDLPSNTVTSIQRLALSKVVGGVASCIES